MILGKTITCYLCLKYFERREGMPRDRNYFRCSHCSPGDAGEHPDMPSEGWSIPNMVVQHSNYPHLHDAFVQIERDNGAHLIGTRYPGEKINLHTFTIPDAWSHLVSGADIGLKRLKETSEADLETFVNGEMSEADEIEKRQGDLAEARIILDGWFNCWPPEDTPFSDAVTRPATTSLQGTENKEAGA